MTIEMDAPAAVLSSLPTPTIEVDGASVPPVVMARLGWLRVRRELNRPSACEFEIEAAVPEISVGAKVSVRIADQTIFVGGVTAIERHLGPDGVQRLRFRAFGSGHRLRLGGRTQAHLTATLAEVFEAAAAQAGLEFTAEADSIRWPRTLQVGESDLALVNRLAAAVGLAWREDGDRLILFDPAQAPVHDLTWGAELIEARVIHDDGRPPGPVLVFGWDPVRRSAVQGRAGEGPGADAIFTGGLFGSDAEAEQLAGSRSGALTAQSGTLRAVLRGDPKWYPGMAARLSGEEVRHRLTSVEQVLDAVSGWVTLVDSEPLPAEPEPAQAAGFALATVLEVDDPDTACRVRVSLDALGELESEWLPVLTPGAGDGRGVLSLPRVGDLVVVLHALADPGRGVVLGGLYPDAAPQDGGLSGGEIDSHLWLGPDGQKLTLSATSDRVVVANRGGSRLEFTESAVTLHAAADLTIAAPGRRLLIRADTVDFERG